LYLKSEESSFHQTQSLLLNLNLKFEPTTKLSITRNLSVWPHPHTLLPKCQHHPKIMHVKPFRFLWGPFTHTKQTKDTQIDESFAQWNMIEWLVTSWSSDLGCTTSHMT
jgi:hypothetical protein